MTQRKSLTILTVLALAFALCFTHIHQGTLAVDAIRYTGISVNMLEKGNWFSPYDVYEQTNYSNKPPLLFWLSAISISLLGFSTFSAKLPAVLFVFCALILMWKVVSEHYGTKAGLVAVILFSANRTFCRDLLDYSFEGVVALGSLLCLKVMLDWVNDRSDLTPKQGIVFGLGIFFLLFSKPPYVVLVLGPIFAYLVVIDRQAISSISRKFAVAAFIPIILASLWFLLSGGSYVEAALKDQINKPLNVTHGYFENIFEWFVEIFKSYAPLSWVGGFALFDLFRREKHPQEKLLLWWLASALPVIVLVECRARYLWIPMLSLVILSAPYFAKKLEFLSERVLERLSMTFFLASLVVFLPGFLIVHRNDPYVTAIKTDSELIQKVEMVCSVSRTENNSGEKFNFLRVLLELEFNKHFNLIYSEDLTSHSGTALVSKECLSTLVAENIDFEVQREFTKGLRLIRFPVAAGNS